MVGEVFPYPHNLTCTICYVTSDVLYNTSIKYPSVLTYLVCNVLPLLFVIFVGFILFKIRNISKTFIINRYTRGTLIKTLLQRL